MPIIVLLFQLFNTQTTTFEAEHSRECNILTFFFCVLYCFGPSLPLLWARDRKLVHLELYCRCIKQIFITREKKKQKSKKKKDSFVLLIISPLNFKYPFLKGMSSVVQICSKLVARKKKKKRNKKCALARSLFFFSLGALSILLILKRIGQPPTR